MIRIAIIFVAGAALTGCQSQALIGSVTGGECKVLERPPYAVRGVAVYDQNWIDRQIEGGVGACQWDRPAPRPPEIDRQPAQHVVVAPRAKRPGLLKRIKARVMPRAWPPALVAPVAAAPAAPPAPVPAPLPAAPPCSAVDRLLHRCSVSR
jgi:hypothetical protein